MKKIIAITLLVVACCVSAQAQKTKTQVRVLNVEASAFVKPLVVELKVDETKGLISERVEIAPNQKIAEEDLNTYAAYVVSQKHHCDVLVAPTFTRIEENGKTTIIVSGFAANYTKWRTSTQEDLQWMQLDSQRQAAGLTHDPQRRR